MISLNDNKTGSSAATAPEAATRPLPPHEPPAPLIAEKHKSALQQQAALQPVKQLPAAASRTNNGQGGQQARRQGQPQPVRPQPPQPAAQGPRPVPLMSLPVRPPTGFNHRARPRLRAPYGQGYGRPQAFYYPKHTHQNRSWRATAPGAPTTGDQVSGTKRARIESSGDEKSAAKKSKTLESRIKMRADIENLIVKNFAVDPAPASAHFNSAINLLLPL